MATSLAAAAANWLDRVDDASLFLPPSNSFLVDLFCANDPQCCWMNIQRIGCYMDYLC